MEAAQLKARTHGEIRAYTDGWTGCIEMVRKQGLLAASRELALMALAEGRITQEDYDEVVKRL